MENENSDASRELNEKNFIYTAYRSSLHSALAFCDRPAGSSAYMTTRMSRLTQFAIFYLAAVHLLLFSICPVSSRIYRTKDAVVIEVDDLLGASSNLAVPNPSTRRSARSTFAGTAIHPYSTGLNYHQKQLLQPNFVSWWYPHLYKRPISRHFLAQDDAEQHNNTSHRATYFPELKQSVIAYGFGPSLQIQKTTPFDSSPDRIFGGVNAAWSFMVGLRLNGGPVFCGGSLISPTKILTAAHCVDRLSVSDISTMSVSLAMTTQGLQGQTSNNALFTKRVVRVVYHIEHNRKTKLFDIAILTIDPVPVSIGNAISVCLPPASTTVDQFAGSSAIIMGWGRTNSSQAFTNILQAAGVKIITNSQCSQTGIVNQGFSIADQHICADGAGISSSCQNDDGGPMVLFSNSPSGCKIQVGITSAYTTNCATKPDSPSVYTNVAFFRDWIDQYATAQYFIKIPTIQNLLGNNYQ